MEFSYTFILLLVHFGKLMMSEQDSEILHHRSCLHLDDGQHYIRPIEDDEYPSILVKCSSGWTIFDYSLDNNIEKYFTSLMHVHDNFATMDYSIEHLNWKEWLNIDDVLLSTSQNCKSCDSKIDTGYYMTGNFYGCTFATKGTLKQFHKTYYGQLDN